MPKQEGNTEEQWHKSQKLVCCSPHPANSLPSIPHSDRRYGFLLKPSKQRSQAVQATDLNSLFSWVSCLFSSSCAWLWTENQKIKDERWWRRGEEGKCYLIFIQIPGSLWFGFSSSWIFILYSQVVSSSVSYRKTSWMSGLLFALS